MTEPAFKLFVPLDEQSQEEEHGVYLKGWASTPDRDSYGDIVIPSGIDASYFINRGYINYEHRQGVEYEIGVPTENTYVDPKKGLFVECKLYTGTPRGMEVWERIKRIQSGQTDERIGFSIEGQRGYKDPITGECYGMRITNVALTSNPANPYVTLESFIKSLVTGYDNGPQEQMDGAALRQQTIAHGINKVAFSLKDLQANDWEGVVKLLDFEGRFDDDVAIVYLQLSEGISRSEAVKRLEETKGS